MGKRLLTGERSTAAVHTAHTREQHITRMRMRKGCAQSREEGSQKSRKGTQEGRKCARLLTRLIEGCKTLWGGAPELGDICLLQDGSEREGILVSNLGSTLKVEAASEGQSRDMRWEMSKRVNGC